MTTMRSSVWIGMCVYTSQTFNEVATNKTLDSNQYVNEYSSLFLSLSVCRRFQCILQSELSERIQFSFTLSTCSLASCFRQVMSNEPKDWCVHTAHADTRAVRMTMRIRRYMHLKFPALGVHWIQYCQALEQRRIVCTLANKTVRIAIQSVVDASLVP